MTVEQLIAMLPQDNDAEAAVLGACLLGRYESVADVLLEDDFYSSVHRTIWRAIVATRKQGQDCDPILLCNTLRDWGELENVGGATYLSTLARTTPIAINAKAYSEIVQRKAFQRGLIDLGGQLQSLALDAGSNETAMTVNDVDRHVRNFTDRYVRSDTIFPIHEVVVPRWEQYEKDRHKVGVLMGLGTGFKSLDGLTGGLLPGDLTILAARPSVGKTSFALAIAHNVAKRGKTVEFASLEMTVGQIADRLVCAYAYIDSQRLRTRNLQDLEWDRAADIAVNTISPLPIYVDGDPKQTTTDIWNRARRIPDLALIVVDYLLLLRDKPTLRNMTRTNHLEEIVRELKAMALDLKVPVLCLTQLSRKVDQEDRAPELWDLRDSGSIEQTADNVVMLHRPKRTMRGTGYKIECYIRKQRNGPSDKMVSLWFNETFAKFEPVDKIGGAG